MGVSMMLSVDSSIPPSYDDRSTVDVDRGRARRGRVTDLNDDARGWRLNNHSFDAIGARSTDAAVDDARV